MEEILEGIKITSYQQTSLFVFDINGIVDYTLNKWTEPNKDCGPLCLFSDLTTAESGEFHSTKWDKFWRCKYIKSNSNSIWIKRKNNSLSITELKNLFKGTILADKIMLIEEINKDTI